MLAIQLLVGQMQDSALSDHDVESLSETVMFAARKAVDSQVGKINKQFLENRKTASGLIDSMMYADMQRRLKAKRRELQQLSSFLQMKGF